MAAHIPDIFPSHMGTEEETMLMIGPSLDDLHAPSHFLELHDIYIPNNIQSVGKSKHYLQNGSVVYDGGQDYYERATPECAGPYQAAQYTIANERLLVDVLSNFVKSCVDLQDPASVRIQRRVIDSYGNSNACHDNFSLAPGILDPESPSWEQDQSALIAHLATRSPITGAGLVTETGFCTAQKATTVVDLDRYHFISSIYRLVTEDESETGPRLEVRCSDINISPWANQVRLGSTALLMATLRTPLAAAIDAIVPPIVSETEALHAVRSRAEIIVDEDANIRPSRKTLGSIDIQERLAELYADKLDQYCDLPDSLKRIAHEIIYFCQDFRKVARGEEEISVLANRSDYAAKLRIIQRSLLHDRAVGIDRSPFDYKSQLLDMKYDLITVTLGQDYHGKSTIRTKYGSGYTLRARGNFAMPIKDADVDHAYYLPPEESRAYTRGTLIRKGLATDDTDWQTVVIRDGLDRIQEITLRPEYGTKESGYVEFIEKDAIPVAAYPNKEGGYDLPEETIVQALERPAVSTPLFIPPNSQ